MKNKGFLIAIEGTDGSGKHLQSELLSKGLKQAGEQVRLLSFPCYDSPSSTLVKMYLGGEFGDDPSKVNPYAASSFYAVDRVASYLKDWKADYGTGKILVADRYVGSNLIHQGSKLPPEERARFIHWARDYEYGALGIPAPNMVIFLDVPTEVSARLRKEREAATNTTADIHEQDNAYLAHCREVALEMADKLDWYVIPCTENGNLLSPEEIHQKILAVCQPKIDAFNDQNAEEDTLQRMLNHGWALGDLMAWLTDLQYADSEDSDRISTPIRDLFAELKWGEMANGSLTPYEKYQLQWVQDHGHSIEELMDELTELQYSDPEDSDQITKPVFEIFKQWEQDCGFGSEIWACREEWSTTEGEGLEVQE